MTKKVEQIIDLLEEAKPTLEEMIGVKLNYYPQSIKKLEFTLNEMFPFGRRVEPTVSLMLGVYLGEVIRKNVKNADVDWGEDTEYAIDTELKIDHIKVKNDKYPTHFIIKPILRMDKFLNQDRTDGLWAMYCMVQDICQGRLDMNPDKKWRSTPRGYTYRSFTMEKENT